MTLQRHALIRGIESMHALFRVSFLVTLQVHALFCDEWSAYSSMASTQFGLWTRCPGQQTAAALHTKPFMTIHALQVCEWHWALESE